MTNKQLADLVCRGLLMIVAALRQWAELPEYKHIIIEISGDIPDNEVIVGVKDYS